MENCVLIGSFAGARLPPDSECVVLIGDGVQSLDRKDNPPGCAYIGKNVVIGPTLYGNPCNLVELLKSIKSHATQIS